MKIKRIQFLVLFAGFAALPYRWAGADSSNDYDENGTKKTYYWQGNQLNNLGRLGNSGDFEEEQRRAAEGNHTEEYLATIREKMARQAHADTQNKVALVFQGQLQGSPIELTYLSPGLRITLHAEALFDENTAAMKPGAVDTLNRLRTMLETEAQKPLQFVIADTLEKMPQAGEVDAERSLVVLSMLQMSDKSDPGL